jgi:DNA ligase-1
MAKFTFSPMLAPLDDPKKNLGFFQGLKYPLLVSPKLDGIRAVPRAAKEVYIDDDFEEAETGKTIDVCLSRALKPIPSEQVQANIARYTDLDGELTAGSPTIAGLYNRTQSAVMSADKPHLDLQYHVFDCTTDDYAGLPFEERLGIATGLVKAYSAAMPLQTGFSIHVVPHTLCRNYDELIGVEEGYLEDGYEGVMMRSPYGTYKWNRATFKEGTFYKLKRFEDDEASIIGFEEGTRNTNEKTTDEKGYAQRSSKKEGLVPSGTLGKFIVSYRGVELRVAPGAFTHAERKAIFDSQEKYLGLLLKFRFFAYGMKDLPRFPRALGFRSKIDMST